MHGSHIPLQTPESEIKAAGNDKGNKMKETDFDISVRNLLQDAEVPVSGKVWKGVSAAIAPRTFTIPFWAYALAGAAAAAAIALGVFLFRPESPATIYPGAIALEQNEIHTEMLSAEVVTPIQKQIASSSMAKQSTAYLEEEAAPVMSEEAPIQEETFVKKEVPAPVRANVPSKTLISDDNAAFNQLAFAEERQHQPNIAFNASADLQNNNRGSFSRAGRFVPRAPQAVNGEGIYNAYPEVAFGLPFAVGVGATYNFANRWSVGIGLRYTMLNRTFVADYYDADEFPYLQTDIDNTQHWLGVPVNLYFDVLSSKYWNFHTFIGGTAEFLLDNDYLIHATPKDIHYHQSNGYPAQLSFGAGLGIEFRFMDNVGLYLDPSLRYYLGTAKQPRSIRTVQPLRMDVEAGLRFYF